MTTTVSLRLAGAIVLTVATLLLLAPWTAYCATVFGRAALPRPDSTGTSNVTASSDYLLGVGKADITGPVVEINLMGYADTAQLGTGLRQRLYCRAFIIGHPNRPSERVVYLVQDTQSGDIAVRHGIIEGLKELGSEYAVYTEQNVAVTGTHSHSGPGAWLNYLLPQITSRGFDKNSYQAIVNGSLLAIQRAHKNLKPGVLSLGSATTSGISINRSPFAYLANPASERDRYATDTDIDMTLLKFEDVDSGKIKGVLTWLPVHGTSLYQNNTLITGDNKGIAAYLVEKAMEAEYPGFVAGFSQSNVGDTSPNVLGAYCEDTGELCRFEDSTCNNRTQGCHGRGPFWQYRDQGTRSCFEIGKRQADSALSILAGNSLAAMEVTMVSSVHNFVDMSTFKFESPFNGSQLATCSAALGYGFAGGTTDGPGAFDFRQGTNDTDDDSPALKNPLWRVARSFVHSPSDEQIECQSPKPILLDVGATKRPYAWTPNIVNIQTLRVGSLVIIVAPGEATTMSGRRWREAVARDAQSVLGLDNPTVVIGGPANTYAHYIATEEEYTVQRYEGASTLFGPNTLAAYINLTLSYLPYLDPDNNLPLLKGPYPPINTNNSYNFITGVVLDNPGFFRSFGKSLTSPDPSKTHLPGEVVSATFVGANPRNDFHLEGTFAAVERYNTAHGKWQQIRSDDDWSLVYHWTRLSTTLGTSEVRIDWEIESDIASGPRQLYRIRYYGDAKPLVGSIKPFEGTSGTFYVGRPSSAGLDAELARGRI